MVQSWVLQCYLVVDANANLFDESKMSPNHKKRQIPCLAWTDWELFKLQFRLYSNKVTFNGSAVINMVFLSVTKYTGWRQRRVALQLWVYLSNLLGLKKKQNTKSQQRQTAWEITTGASFSMENEQWDFVWRWRGNKNWQSSLSKKKKKNLTIVAETVIWRSSGSNSHLE